ncbi:BON domain-containing protein [Asticcacaulis sp. 201]|uniref:BON domain-containing protein n=1 Tax=Asticcacaulis sp. 201 TaxID=3028787 RepID=UPI0029167AD0|nr:BON domain-containing protein [Asticcacaulis sp. 201]MDV6331116.1 BON domain-containing protein [Asticcacaulis sp. 201]
MKDATLRKHILDELEFDPAVDAQHIGVSVDDGIVSLSGHVTSYAEKRAAENAVSRVRGVRAIAEDIAIVARQPTKVSDEDIARQALAIISWDTTIPKDKVKVRVENGWVTLDGDVDSYFQRRNAEDAVHRLAGVEGITNRINMRIAAQPADVHERIVAAFHRDASLDPSDIRLTAFGGKVTLDGTVHTLYERQLAERAAWSAPGVTYVESHLRVDETAPVN